jgi:integrase
VPDRSTLKGKRDYVILALLVGCALRRNELAELRRRDHPATRGQVGPGRPGGQRPAYPHRRHPHLGQAGYQRLDDRGRNRGRPAVAVNPSISKSGKINGDSLSDWAVWSVVEQSSKQIGIEHFGAHDLRHS